MKKKRRFQGIAYTPHQIAEYMARNTLKIYLKNYFHNNNIDYTWSDLLPFEENLIHLNNHAPNFNSILKNIKILDPACGSGRFLIAIAKYLYLISTLNGNEKKIHHIKKKIIEKNLYGNDIDIHSCIISRFQLLKWLSSDIGYDDNQIIHDSIINFEMLLDILDSSKVNYNIHNDDYLMDFKHKPFDIIIGNPPYIENKKIDNILYKKKLVKRYISAYKLFDLSSLFIERSISLIDKKVGVIGLLVPNKFLAANYGIKIRQLILDDTYIEEIVNISSLLPFKNISTYPVIIFLSKNCSSKKITHIRNIMSLDHINYYQGPEDFKYKQQEFKKLPNLVIPLSRNIGFISQLYSKFDTLSEKFRDLKIVYRPYGFIKWAENSKYIRPKLTNSNDLILIGTGNVQKYKIDFSKKIKIGNKTYIKPYFQFQDKFKDIWDILASEKIIFREIAKNLSFAYDPGLYTNLTGLYFIKLPSLNTNQLLSLLAILNSNLINCVFRSLYGTLHMSHGYLRINGSFIKSLPMPNKLPNILAKFSKLLCFLNELDYHHSHNNNHFLELNWKVYEINQCILIIEKLCNSEVNNLYEIASEKPRLEQTPIEINMIPDIPIKHLYSDYNHPKFIVFSEKDLLKYSEKVRYFFNELKDS